MPRHRRIHAPGIIYHIIARGNNGQNIYLSDGDRRQFLSFIGSTKRKYPFKLFSYVLMSNHFHLLVEVGEKSTSRIMQSLLTSYSRYFNRIHKQRGHLFQGRYKAILCEKDTYLLELLRYIHFNPVRAKLADSMDRWEWSSHGDYSGRQSTGLIDAGIVIELFGKGGAGYGRYRQFMEDKGACEVKKEFYPGENNPFLGRVVEIQRSAESSPREAGRKSTLEMIAEMVAKKTRLSRVMILQRTKQRDVTRARKMFMLESIKEGFRQSEIARFLRCDQSYVSRSLQKRMQMS